MWMMALQLHVNQQSDYDDINQWYSLALYQIDRESNCMQTLCYSLMKGILIRNIFICNLKKVYEFVADH